MSLVPPGHATRAIHLSSLGTTLLSKFKLTGERRDGDEAVRLCRQAVAATAVDDPQRATMLSHLSLAVQARFESCGTIDDLDEAVTLAREASRTTPESHPYHGTYMANLGIAVRARHGHSAEPADLDEAIEATRRAARATPVGHPDLARRLSNLGVALQARQASSGTLADLDEAIFVGREAVRASRAVSATDDELLALTLTNLGSALHARFDWLGAAGDLDEAILVGRQALEVSPVGGPSHAVTRSNLSGALLARLLRSDDPSDLDEAIALGRPCPHPRLCDGVTELGELTEHDVIVEASRYLQALHDFEQDIDPRLEVMRSLERTISTTLAWLWDSIMRPILDHLHLADTPLGRQPRVSWCPTGSLTLLPLHAAGYHRNEGESVLDRVISSYVPTLRSLARARTTLPPQRPRHILVVAVPDAPGQAALPNADAELSTLTSLFPPTSCTVLTGEFATRQAILANLDQHRWLHAACHGTQDLANPVKGGLVPHDWATGGWWASPT